MCAWSSGAGKGAGTITCKGHALGAHAWGSRKHFLQDIQSTHYYCKESIHCYATATETLHIFERMGLACSLAFFSVCSPFARGFLAYPIRSLTPSGNTYSSLWVPFLEAVKSEARCVDTKQTCSLMLSTKYVSSIMLMLLCSARSHCDDNLAVTTRASDNKSCHRCARCAEELCVALQWPPTACNPLREGSLNKMHLMGLEPRDNDAECDGPASSTLSSHSPGPGTWQPPGGWLNGVKEEAYL